MCFGTYWLLWPTTENIIKCFYPLQSYSCDHDEHDGVRANDAVDYGDSSDVGDNVAVNHDDHVWENVSDYEGV